MIPTHLHKDGYLSRGEGEVGGFTSLGYQGGNSLVVCPHSTPMFTKVVKGGKQRGFRG